MEINKFKFSGKERDSESGWDYFGARYYDSRVGRWFGVDPLAVKYQSVSSFSYALNNPVTLLDPNGQEVLVYGKDAEKAVEELNEFSDLEVSYDDETGRVVAEGDAKTPADKKLQEATTSTDVTVNLETTRDEIVDGQPINTGAFMGSEKADGKTTANQVVNMNHAKAREQLGGSSQGQSVAHEVIEAYIGGKTGEGFEKSHQATLLVLPDSPGDKQITVRGKWEGKKIRNYMYSKHGTKDEKKKKLGLIDPAELHK